MKALRYSYLLIIVLVLSGCSLFSPVKNEQTRYQLSSVPGVRIKHTRNVTLLVLKPETTPLYHSTQMVYKKQPYQVAYFAKNRWADTPVNMLQQLMVQTLQNTHYFHAIVTPPFTAQYDYVLSTQLIELQQDFTRQPSVVRIKLRAQLIQANTSRVIRAKEFSAVAYAPQNSPQGGVIAANRAVEQVLKQVSAFCTH